MKSEIGAVKAGLTACALSALASTGLFAACPVEVWPGVTGSTTNPPAPSTRYRYVRGVYLITASELASAGITTVAPVTGIGWSFQAAPGVAGSAPLVVYLENTADTTNLKSATWATAIAGMTTVHSATTTLPNTVGPYNISFTGGSPFTYTGGGLYVAFDWGQYTGTLSSTVTILCNPDGSTLLGDWSNWEAPAILTSSLWRPATRLSLGSNNDAGVNLVYAMGGLPLGLTGPSVFGALVSNNGNSPITALPVTLSIAGANAFNDTQFVAFLPPCSADAVSFAGFTPSAVGGHTAIVMIPSGDDVPGNDFAAKPLDVSAGGYTYKYPGTVATGGTGFSGATGELYAKFKAVIPSRVGSVSLEFFAASATAYRVVVRGDDGAGGPGALLYEDAADRTVNAAGPVTLTLLSPVGVGPGNFFVGLRQTNTTALDLAYDAENPIRLGAFYFATPTGMPYTDFSPSRNFKPNIGLALAGCYPPTSVDVTPDAPQAVCPGVNTAFTATPAGGTPPFTYQWTEDGVDIPGATGTTLTVNKAAGGTFIYNCKVGPGPACPTAQDSAAPTLTVLGAPSITAQPSGQTACSGGTALFTVGTSGAGLTYRWQGSSDFGATYSDISDGGPYAGTATSTLAVAATPDMHARFFRVHVAGTCPSPLLTSDSAALSVSGPYSAPVLTGVTPISACSQSGVQVAYAPAVGAARHDLYADGVTAVSGYASGAVYNPGDALPHSYSVVGVNGACTTPSAPSVFADDGQSPPAVGNLALAREGTSLRFTWTGLPAGTVDSYEVMRGASPQGPFDQRVGSVSGLAAVGADGVLATGLIVDLAGEPARAYYKVRAVKGACAGPLD